MPEPTRWRKKPVVIEAVQLPTDLDAIRAEYGGVFGLWEHLSRWAPQITVMSTPGSRINFEPGGPYHLRIETLEGTMTARPGDWIVKGVKGEVYPVRADIFADTYEPAEETVRIIDGAGRVHAEYPVNRLADGMANPPEKLLGGDDA